MRKYFYKDTDRKVGKHEFPLEKDARTDDRYSGNGGSMSARYYTEPRNDIKEKWQGKEWYDCYTDNDRKVFALLRRCYSLGMMYVNEVDLISAYSCLRANPASQWGSKISQLLGDVLELGSRQPDNTEVSKKDYKPTVLMLYETRDIKVINPLPEIIWRDETDEIYWQPHQHDDFIYYEKFGEYFDKHLFTLEQNKIDKKQIRNAKQQAPPREQKTIESFIG